MSKKTDCRQTIILKISGPSSDLEYSFDKEEIKNDRKEKIKTEKEIIKVSLKAIGSEEKKEPEIFEVQWEEEVDTTVEVEKTKKPKKNRRKKILLR